MDRGVGVLMERNRLSLRELPNMRKGSPEALARCLIRTAVLAERDNNGTLFLSAC